MDDLILSTDNLSFCYPNSEPIAFDNLSIRKGQHTLILGNSGTGKSTLLNLLGGFSKPTTGTVILHQQDIYQLKGSEIDQFRAQTLGFIFQEAHLLKNLSISENIKLAQSLAKRAVEPSKISALLEQLQLRAHQDKKPNQLSRGQLQRASIARALINQPAILIADEPTASLDDTNTQKVIDLLMNLANEHGSTLLIATHDKRIKDEFSNTYLL